MPTTVRSKLLRSKRENRTKGKSFPDIQTPVRERILRTCLILFCLLAVLIRTVKFGSVPGGMNQDGAMAAVDAAALAKYGTDRLGMKLPVHLTAWGFGQMSALMSYLMVPFIALFGLSAISARLPSLLVSLMGLAALYGFARKGYGRTFALVILFLGAINPWHILQSRWALDCNLFPHFLMLGLYLLLRGTEKKKLLFLSAAAFGLSMYCYGISVYTVPVLLAAAFIYLYRGKLITVRDGLLYAGIYLLIAWPFLLCMILNFLGLETIETPLFTIPYFPDSLRSGDILFFSEHPFRQLISNLQSTFRILLQRYGWSVCNEINGFGTMYVFSVPFMAIGAVSLFRRFRRDTAAGLTCLLFLTGFLDGLITANVNINRINLIFYALLLFTGAGIETALKAVRKSSAALHGVLGSGIAVLYLTGFVLFTKAYFTSYADLVSETFMADFGEAMAAVKEAESDGFYITPDAQYKGYWYVSEVLTLFYHDIDAEFYQSAAFAEQYHFVNPEKGSLQKDAVYVTTTEYADVFEGEPFTVTRYGRFLTAVPE